MKTYKFLFILALSISASLSAGKLLPLSSLETTDVTMTSQGYAMSKFLADGGMSANQANKIKSKSKKAIKRGAAIALATPFLAAAAMAGGPLMSDVIFVSGVVASIGLTGGGAVTLGTSKLAQLFYRHKAKSGKIIHASYVWHGWNENYSEKKTKKIEKKLVDFVKKYFDPKPSDELISQVGKALILTVERAYLGILVPLSHEDKKTQKEFRRYYAMFIHEYLNNKQALDVVDSEIVFFPTTSSNLKKGKELFQYVFPGKKIYSSLIEKKNSIKNLSKQTYEMIFGLYLKFKKRHPGF